MKVKEDAMGKILDVLREADRCGKLSNPELVREMQRAFDEPVNTGRYALLEAAWNRLHPNWFMQDPDAPLPPLVTGGQGRTFTTQSMQETGEACMWALIAAVLVIMVFAAIGAGTVLAKMMGIN